MSWNPLQATGKLFFHRTHNRHSISLADSQNSFLVYAVKPLNDKGFAKSWAAEAFCYTWPTPQGPEARFSPKKGPG
jgi:hypothetical protein